MAKAEKQPESTPDSQPESTDQQSGKVRRITPKAAGLIVAAVALVAALAYGGYWLYDNQVADQDSDQTSEQLEEQPTPSEIKQQAYDQLPDERQAEFATAFSQAVTHHRDGDQAAFERQMEVALADFDPADMTSFEARTFVEYLFDANEAEAKRLYSEIKPAVGDIEGAEARAWSDVALLAGDRPGEVQFLEAARDYYQSLEGEVDQAELDAKLELVESRLADD